MTQETTPPGLLLYPASAGAEGDPLKLAEERASTYLDVNRGKLVRTCSPTVRGVKDAVYGRLAITEPGPGFIHFPADDAFGESYFLMLTAERREVRKRAGQPYVVWVPIGAARQDLLLHGTDDALLAHDASMAKVRAKLEQVQARRDALQPEWAEAEAREAAARSARERADAYAAAAAVRDEAADLLRSYISSAAIWSTPKPSVGRSPGWPPSAARSTPQTATCPRVLPPCRGSRRRTRWRDISGR